MFTLFGRILISPPFSSSSGRWCLRLEQPEQEEEG